MFSRQLFHVERTNEQTKQAPYGLPARNMMYSKGATLGEVSSPVD
jgi:hypothetical protein